MAETQNTGQFAKTIVTDVGKDMIAKSQNGQTLTFSRVALGDGLVGEEEDVTKFTAVKNERLSLPIAKYSNLGNGQFQIQFRLTNSQVESGFWHREIGVMAKIDNGQEQLYAYTTAGNKASFIYDKTTPVEERIVNVNFVIGNAQNLEVIINSSVIYATIEDLEEALDAHDAGADAHEPAFNAHNAADDAHKDFTGATSGVAGKRGMVPAPGKNQQNALLGGDGLWHGIATIEEIDAGINDNKIISAKALKNARPLKTYTDWGQLNLNENNTLNDLISALPNGSLFINFVLNLNYQSMGLPARGYLLVSKENGNHFALLREHYSSDGHLWYYTTDNGGTWKRIATANEIHAIATSEQLQAGIDNTTIVTPAGLTVARPLKTYTNWDQLGFTVNDGIDIKDVCDALPADSMFVCIVWDGDVDKITNLPIKSKGKLFIYKTGGESTLYFITSSRQMYCGWSTTTFYEWVGILPTGTILPFAGGTIPNGFLACNGAAVSRTTYAALFSAIGTTYGSGDGSTTFNLPLAEDNRFLEFASTAGTKKNAGLPNITGGPRSTGIGGTVNSNIMWSGALGTQVVNQNTNSRDGGSSPYYGSIQTTIDASKSSSIYGGSTTVQPKSLTVRAIIKY